MKIRIYTTYRQLSDMFGLQINKTNFEYWRCRSDFKFYNSYEKDDCLFLEKNIVESDLYYILSELDKHKLTYEFLKGES